MDVLTTQTVVLVLAVSHLHEAVIFFYRHDDINVSKIYRNSIIVFYNDGPTIFT